MECQSASHNTQAMRSEEHRVGKLVKATIPYGLTEAAQFTHRRGHQKHHRLKLTANMMVGNEFLQFNTPATQLLGVSLDTHLTFEENLH